MKKIIVRILIVIMLLCVTVTYLKFSASVNCSNCEAIIRGKYYIAMTEEIMCSKCSEAYYSKFPEGTEKTTGKVDNMMRNYICVVELVLFGSCVILLSKKKRVQQYEEIEIAGKKRAYIESSGKKRVGQQNSDTEILAKNKKFDKNDATKRQGQNTVNKVEKTPIGKAEISKKQTPKKKDLTIRPAGDL